MAVTTLSSRCRQPHHWVACWMEPKSPGLSIHSPFAALASPGISGLLFHEVFFFCYLSKMLKDCLPEAICDTQHSPGTEEDC